MLADGKMRLGGRFDVFGLKLNPNFGRVQVYNPNIPEQFKKEQQEHNDNLILHPFYTSIEMASSVGLYSH